MLDYDVGHILTLRHIPLPTQKRASFSARAKF